MARVVVIEELGNGFVVRCTGDAGCGAVAMAGDEALRKALEHAKLYFLSPAEVGTGAASFSFQAISVPEMGALEPKPKTVRIESDRLAPTDVHPAISKDPRHAQTVRKSRPWWKRVF